MTKAKHWAALAAAFGLLAGGVALAHGTGPHKGPVAEWGEEEYHVEVVPDAQAGTVTAYVYGDHDDLVKGKAKAIDAKNAEVVQTARALDQAERRAAAEAVAQKKRLQELQAMLKTGETALRGKS